MHRIGPRLYTGLTNEPAVIRVSPSSGAFRIVLNGVDHGSTSPFNFNLDPSAGEVDQLSIGLIASPGATAAIRIETVDGGADHDLLIASNVEPVPVAIYQFTALAPAAHKVVSDSMAAMAGGK